MRFRFSKIMIIGFISILLITFGLQPAYAVDKSRVLTWLIFFSGLGSSAAGAIIQGQANETYDKYMHTAIQADMESFADDYERKRQQSVIASRAGVGLVIGAVLISLIDAAHIPQPEIQETPSLFGGASGSPGSQIISAHTEKGDLRLAIGSRF